MNIILKDILAIFGVMFLGLCIFFVLIALIDWIKGAIRQAKVKYYIKHRFDKPPTAKCYCIDCKHHDRDTKRCYRFGQTTKEYRCTADEWFCWEADPGDR